MKDNGENKIVKGDFSEEPLVIHPSIIEAFKKEDNTADLIAAYVLYYHTAKWQKTNKTKANDSYVRKCFSWGRERLKKAKDTLKNLGFIEPVADRDEATGKVKQWYTKVNYIWSVGQMSEIGIVESRIPETHNVDSPTCSNQDANALSLNIINASSLNSINTVARSKELPTECYDITDMLIDFVKTKHKLTIDGKKRRAWADHIRKLNEIDGVEYDSIFIGVKWYIAHADFDQYMPKIESAKKLRDRWTNLRNAYLRISGDSNKSEKESKKTDAMSNVLKELGRG